MASSTKSLIHSSWGLSLQLLRQQLKPLFFILLAGSLITIQVEDAVQGLTAEQESLRWMLQLGIGLWDLFEGILLFLVLSWGVAKIRKFNSPAFEPNPFVAGYLGSFLAEYFRVLAQVLFYFLLLILPALIRYCRLIFVPYIALFSKQYREDKVDAVALSIELSKKYFFKILIVFILTTAVQVGLEFLPQLVTELHFAAFRVLLMTFAMALSIWFYSFVFVIFQEALEEKTWT